MMGAMTHTYRELQNEEQEDRKLGLWEIGWVFIAIGLGISLYLSYIEISHSPIQCLDNALFDCTAVQSSVWAKVFGIPTAWFGLMSYAFIAGIWYGELYSDIVYKYGRLILFTVGIIAWGYSMWLFYVQLVIIDAFCQWCLLHEINITILFVLITYRLWNE